MFPRYPIDIREIPAAMQKKPAFTAFRRIEMKALDPTKVPSDFSFDHFTFN
jgi:hypothetical protein